MNSAETLALFARGKDAWNDWAMEMLAQRSRLPPALRSDGGEPRSEAGKAWADQARGDFAGVNFNEDCDFAGFVFPGKAEFWPLSQKSEGGISQIPTCFPKRVSFDGAKFLGQAWFFGAAFKDEASFRDVEFAGCASFKDTIFGGNAWFNLAKFDEVLFDKARFEAAAIFANAAFAETCTFNRVTFSGAAIFRSASACKYTSFTETEFLGEADFCESNFTDDLRMDHAKFARNAQFLRASFKTARFRKTKFAKAARFDRAAFTGYTSFRGAVFTQEANFEGIRSEGGFEVELATFLKLPNFDDASFTSRIKPNPRILAEPKPRKRSKAPLLWEFHCDYYGRPLFWTLENVERLQTKGRGLMAPTPWPDDYLQSLRGPWNLPDYLERPRFVIDEKTGRLPRDLESYDGFFFISNAMKAVFEALDPSACDIRPCDTVLSSGEPGPELWLCSVTRALFGAIDLERSAISVGFFRNDGLPVYSLGGDPKLRFKPEIIGDAHLFHAVELGSHRNVFCAEAFKQACKDAGLRGIRFTSYQ